LSERRANKRVSLRDNVRYGPTEPPQHISFITNLSTTGVYIHTNRVFALGTRLFLVFETRNGRLKAEGVVVWTRKAPPHLIRHIKSGMGIKFTRADEALLDLVRERS